MRAQQVLTGVCLTASTLLVGCGQVGEPLYPALRIPTRVGDLTAVERGDKIDIRFTIPPLTTEGLALKNIGTVDLRIGPNPSGAFSANDWANGAQKIQVPTPAQPGAVDASVSAKDLIGKELVVGVRVANGNNRFSDWSNFYTLTIEPPLATPTDFRAETVPEGVRLTWKAPGENSFRIFRKESEQKEPTLLATSDQAEYVDLTTEYGKAYEYFLQGLHDKAETNLTQAKTGVLKDTFPPHVPSGLTASLGVGSVDLAWDRNTESDFKQYRVFRSEGNGPFVQIAEGLEGPVYSDHSVVSGKHYRYRIVAVDQVGNASAPCEPIEVTVP